jgi:hypothetical protein
MLGASAALEAVSLGALRNVASDCWGRGYATEAASASLAAALRHLVAPRIIAVVNAENEASLRLPLRIGMKRIDAISAQLQATSFDIGTCEDALTFAVNDCPMRRSLRLSVGGRCASWRLAIVIGP